MSNRVTQIDPLQIQARHTGDADHTPIHMDKISQGAHSHCLSEKPKADNAIQETRSQADQLPPVMRGPPSDKFIKRFSCRLAGSVTVVERIEDRTKIVHIREFSKFSKDKADCWLQVLRSTHHPNITSAIEIYKDHGMTYFVVDDLPLTLENLAACEVLPSELEYLKGYVTYWSLALNMES
ncbi:hypothetical protein AtubIFM54640_011314 [Aspergillus tubingensis]|nr:hypothetical protein AtubIFM54640_011314 [Aspergillus tubingensis]